MKEHTDKASKKSGKAAPKGARPGKARSPESRQATAPGEGSAAGKESGQPASSSLAPDPATITFGSNRPIVAAPTKVPEGSGLRFSGPSLGELKASGPQPSSAKASGLTFTSAKNGGTSAKNGGAAAGDGKTSPTPPKGAPAKCAADHGSAKTDGKTPGAPKDAGKGDEATDDKKATGKATTDKHAADKKSADRNAADRNAAEKSGTESGASKVPPSGGKTPAKPAPLTKPAIAPQQSGRRLEKERSSSGFALTLMGLVAVVGGLAYWMNGNDQPAAPGPEIAAVAPEAAAEAAREAAPAAKPPAAAVSPGPTPDAAPLGPSPRAPESPGPLIGEAPAKVASTPPAKSPALSAAEIVEIQKLLDNLGLGPGNLDGVVSAETTAAIRAYQEMAGLPASGVADQVLLEELRSVAELYGG